MFVGLFASLLGTFFGWMMALMSIFLILLVLVQRGRGGGLTGALGGPGGQSAFGSKAGDTFTRITFGVAGVWIVFCALAMYSLGNARTAYIDEDVDLGIGGVNGEENTMTIPPADSGTAAPAGGTGINLGGLDALNNLNPPAVGGDSGTSADEAGAAVGEAGAAVGEAGESTAPPADAPPADGGADAAAGGSEEPTGDVPPSDSN